MTGLLARLDPLRLSGTALPRSHLMAGRLLALGLVIEGYVLHLPRPHVSFVPALETMLPPPVTKAILLGSLAGGLVLLFIGILPRLGAFLAGAALVIATIACPPLYANSRLYSGCVLLLLGLWQPGSGTTLLRAQVVLLYAGATLSKLFDVDWWDGRYFDAWMNGKLRSPLFGAAAALLPPLALAKLCGWATILAEGFVAVGLPFRKTRVAAVVAGLLFHVGALALAGEDFGVFFYAVTLSYLFFAEPEDRLSVRGAERVPLARWLVAVDRDRFFIVDPAGGGTLEVSGAVGHRTGGAALRAMLLASPLPYFLLLPAMMVLPATLAPLRSTLAVAALLVVSPPVMDRLARATKRPPPSPDLR